MDPFDDKWQRRQERWAQRQERHARRQERRAREHSPMHGVLIGGLVITVGVVFLLDNLGIIRLHDIWSYWPAILIVFGLARITEAHGPSAIIWGSVVAGIGALLLADNLNWFYFDWRIVWPILIIAWGLIMLLRPRYWRAPPVVTSGFAGMAPPNPSAGTDTPTISLVTIFGGGRRQIDSQDFRGGEITATFGGYELDLRNAAIATGPAVIDVTAMFGGIEIRVPGTWTVEARGVGIFGGFGDETRQPRPGEVTREQRLIVSGTAVFGGVSIKN
jgi:predicted membrane protein